MILRVGNSLASSSSVDFLSINGSSNIHSKNLTGWVWMEEMKDEKSDGSEGGDTENGVVFIDLPFIITPWFISPEFKTFPLKTCSAML